MSALNFALAVLFFSAANCQECELYSSSQLATLISSSIDGEPNYVCLHSGTRRDTYQTASVVVNTGGQDRQLVLTCGAGSTWTLTSNNIAAANSSTATRRDCGGCTAASNDPSFDTVTQCVPCPNSCVGLRQCTSFLTASDCCNFYDNDTCTQSCNTPGTSADDSTGYVCIDPCAGNPCSNGGICTASGVRPSCACSGSWSGERCETCDIADCVTCSSVTNVCSQCRSSLDLLASGACACSVQCGSGGVLDDTLCQCNCSSGYSGATCLNKCTVENCLSCPSDSLGTCSVCIDGYDVEDGGQTCSRSSTFIGSLSLAAFIGIIVAAAVVAVLILLCLFLTCYCLCCKRGSAEIV